MLCKDFAISRCILKFRHPVTVSSFQCYLIKATYILLNLLCLHLPIWYIAIFCNVSFFKKKQGISFWQSSQKSTCRQKSISKSMQNDQMTWHLEGSKALLLVAITTKRPFNAIKLIAPNAINLQDETQTPKGPLCSSELRRYIHV